jgi:hypothetical protein
MTVDSEAIFAIAAHSHSDPHALEALHGSMAAAWLDARQPQLVHVARGVGRPLWLGKGRDGSFFASTKVALEVLERYLSVKLRKRELREGTLLALKDGAIARKERFHPDLEYVEHDPLPSVRAPLERDVCLSRLAALAA